MSAKVEKAPPAWVERFALNLRAAGIAPPTPEHRFHPVRKWRLDLAWVAANAMVD